MSRIRSVPHASWSEPPGPDIVAGSQSALESGEVLFFPALPFTVGSSDTQIFSPAILSSSKNASFDPSTGRVGGTTLEGPARDTLRDVMSSFSDHAERLVRALFPSYREHLTRARTSFRPAEIAGRATSWRKDDTRLHVDAFPASPTSGRRILRVFANVNPEGRARTWRVGPDFRDVADHFNQALSVPFPGTGFVLRLFRVTKATRTPYDALMLQLHDAMKADAAFQEGAAQERYDFPAGSTWLAFTDQVSHAALAGQYQFEQTFLLPVTAMADASRSPLRTLEALKQRTLT